MACWLPPRGRTQGNPGLDHGHAGLALLGTPRGALEDDWDTAISVGVTDVACLMDFGVPRSLVLASLPYLAELERTMARPRPAR